MTVGELHKKILQLIEDGEVDSILVMSKDAEGNSYSPLFDLDKCSYVSYNTWSGEIGLRTLTEELREEGYSHEDVKDGQKAIVLYPTN